MSRSYRTLALALVGMLVLVGLAKLVERDPSGSNSAAAAAAPGDTTGSTDVAAPDQALSLIHISEPTRPY